RMDKKLVKGRWLRPLENKIIIGKIGARLLKVGVGGKVQLTLADVHGNVTRIGLRVGGIFETGGPSLDRAMAIMPDSVLQHFTKMGQGVTQIAVMWRLDKIDDLAARIRRKLPAPGVIVQTWDQALPMLSQLIAFKKGGNSIFLIVIFFIVAASILNTVLMSVLERTREFGVLLSLGARPMSLFRLIMGEALFMAIIAVSIGLVVGLTMSFTLMKIGIDPKAFSGSGEAMEAGGVVLSERLYPVVTAWSCIWTSMMVVGIVLVSALFPAIRAARISPVRAVREN
ncbi:FtsX-like permease family protein, partial [Myxococcota bacterium]|nr:FtsX-like permease family protein [Myxococcota bacterium]